MTRLQLLASIAAVVVVAGCGTTTVKTVTEQAPVARSEASDRARDAAHQKWSARRSAAKRESAKRTSTKAASAKRGSTKRSSAKATASGRWTACDDNIDAWSPLTSCAFAQNAFYEYWTAGRSSPVMVHSPALGRALRTRCRSGASRVTCSAEDGGRARFTFSALDVYSSQQAASYAATHDTGSDSTSSLSGGGSGAGDSYDEGDSSYDDYDDSSGDEIPYYDQGTGYRVRCADGMYSQSGGRPGACSGHGGVDE